MKIPRHSLTSDCLFYSKSLIKKRQMDIFIKKKMKYLNINILYLYKDNQIESRKDHTNRFQFRSISNNNK